MGKKIVYTASLRDNLDDFINAMIQIANNENQSVTCEFAGVDFTVDPNTTFENAENSYYTSNLKRYFPSYYDLETCQKGKAKDLVFNLLKSKKMEIEDKKKKVKELVYSILETQEMAVKKAKEEKYKKLCDEYEVMDDNNPFEKMGKESFAVYRAWAIEMQNEIDKGKELVDVMDVLMPKLDFVGFNGIAYKNALAFLKEYWEYGDQLP